MSKPRTKQPKDVTPFWQERGFRSDIATLPPDPNEDPKGESAYQREFLKAAQLKPPRVPNPASFPNSPSAREYIQRSSKGTTASRVERRPGEGGNDTSRARSREWEPDMGSDMISKKSSSTSPASNYSMTTTARPSLPSIMSIPRGDENANAAFGDQRQLPPLPSMTPGTTPGNRAAFLETGPRGPSNVLRPFF